VPVLARTLEAAGLSTIMVTPMPCWAEKIGVPRTLAVAFPFGQTLGQPGNPAQQMEVILLALKTLAELDAPGGVVHASAVWPQPVKGAIKDWQPAEPSPIVQEMAPQIRSLMRQRRDSMRSRAKPD
jgi:hypothetical protein